MTHSRSIASISRLLAVVVAVAAVLGVGRVAEAGRKRVVVLDFEGPKGDKFHEDLVRLIKKTHTVVPAEKWNGTAEQLGAGTLSGKDVKKVARKLKIDAIVQGKIEKRRDEFIIRIKLRAGKSGELIGDSIDTKAEGPRIDGRAQKDLRDELVGKIDDIESNHDGAGGDDEDESPPARRAAKSAKDEDDEDKPVHKAAKTDKAAKAAKAEKDDDDDDAPKKTARRSAKKDDKKEDEEDAGDDRPSRRSKFAGRSDDERGSDKVGKARKPEPDSRDDEDDKAPPKKTAKASDKADKSDDEDKLPPKKTAKAPDKSDKSDKPEKSDKSDKSARSEDDEDKLPPKKPAAKASSDDTRLAAKEPAKKPAARGSSEDDEDKLPPKKSAGKSAASGEGRRGKTKKVASREDDEASAEAEVEDRTKLVGAAAVAPGERFLDAALGMSFTARRFTFAYRAELRQRPNNYAGVPAPGALVDVTLYPLALGHSRHDVYKDLGLNVVYDRVLALKSKVPVAQPNGMTTTANYSTLESRFALDAVYRHAFGRSATAPVVLGTLGYQRQMFNILGTVDLPDVKYSLFSLGGGIRFPVFSKLVLDLDAKLLLPFSVGEIGHADQYGQTKVLGFDLSLGADYLIMPNVFVRAAGRVEVFSFDKFTGSRAVARDNDPTTPDVTGAHDNYLGGFLSIGYLY